MSRPERDSYLNLCDANKVLVDQNVLRALSNANLTSLDLSGLSLTKETCEILSKVLISTTVFHDLNFTDCLLPPRGLASILKSLSHVSCLKHLDLKGNNISGSSIAKLGQMLSNNSSLKRINLEWNSLGLFPEPFKEFCSGLSKNSCLEDLDLQNNRLTPECASMLSNALSSNKTLRSLDVRWNEIGWQGGQYIYDALQANSSLECIQLQGNCIPSDLMQAIEQCSSHNLSRHKVVQECSVRNQLLAKHVRRVEAKRTLEIESLAKQNEEIIKETEIRLNTVEEVLNEKNAALANAQVQIKSLQVELRKQEQMNHELKELMEAEKEGKQFQADKHHADLEKLKKKCNEDIQQLEDQLEIIENNLLVEKGKVADLSKKLMLAEDEVRSLQANQSGLIDIERKRHKDEMELSNKEHEGKYDRAQKEFDERMNSLKTDALRTQQRLTDRISSLEASIFDLERKLSEQSAHAAHMSQELARSSEITALAVQEAKEKEQARIKIVEENLETARDGRLRAEKQLETVQRNMALLQEQNNSLIAELGEPQRKLAQLHEELSRERDIVSRLRVEKNEEVSRADARKADADRLQLEVDSLNRQLMEMKNLHLVSEQKWKEEREKVHAELVQKERDIQRIRSDEVERAAALYSAFTKYLGNVHPSSTSFLIK
ncbi:Leucine-rich repeat-containing protein 45 [Frankliniella fusca]|uniref:Leucine-rich repeat-containing protein 45 n=1 Tax=Frankliniella fusca TaxID=407009 RepID=A0AAE1HXI7_9NEOP|nr:Leucine-rich repeat-containing protein 45 [Frankliniella fusca]